MITYFKIKRQFAYDEFYEWLGNAQHVSLRFLRVFYGDNNVAQLSDPLAEYYRVIQVTDETVAVEFKLRFGELIAETSKSDKNKVYFYAK